MTKYEYAFIHDRSEDLDLVNKNAEDGWRVIAMYQDSARGPKFILEREIAS